MVFGGVRVDAESVDSADRVKSESLMYFANQFGAPSQSQSSLKVDFPDFLAFDEVAELEVDVTLEEIKRVVQALLLISLKRFGT